MQRKIEIANDTQTFRVLLDGVSQERINEIGEGTRRLVRAHKFEISAVIAHDEQTEKGEIILTNVNRVSDAEFARQESLMSDAFFCFANAVT